MPFPDLQLATDVLKGGGTPLNLAAEATGVPDAGNNTFALPFVAAGIDPALIAPERLKIYYDADPSRPAGGSANPGVTDVRFVSLAPDKQSITLSFDQSGAGDCRIVMEVVQTIDAVGSIAGPVIVSGSPAGGGGGATGPSTLTRTYVVGVLLNDVVYETATPGEVDRADASAVATGNPLGIVSAIDSPAVGQCQVLPVGGDLAGFVGLTPGAQYILAASPGAIVNVTDTVNPNYPAYLTPASGEVLAPVGIASAADTLAVNTTPGIQAVG